MRKARTDEAKEGLIARSKEWSLIFQVGIIGILGIEKGEMIGHLL
jgi:hypothetical protein